MSFSDWLTLITIVCSAFIGSIGGVWGLAWWMQKQFNSTRHMIFAEVEKIMNKLDQHEEYDNKRFQDIRDDIWLMRVRNAARDGVVAGNNANSSGSSSQQAG